MSRYPGGGGGGSSNRRPAYQTSSSSRNYSSTQGASERDYSRSHLSSGNGGNSANYYSSSSASRKPEPASTGYSYLEPNWIEKTRSSIPIDPYGAASYLDRAPLATSRDYSTAASAQPVYPSAAAAALSVGAYTAGNSMPKAYARPDEYFRAAPAAAAALASHTYGYGVPSAFDQSTMAAQAAAIYEMQNSNKRDVWPPAPHLVEYGRREDDRRVSGGDRRREDGRRDERRVDDRRVVDDRRAPVVESWREREREVPRDRDHRRPSVPTRERDRDLRVTVPASSRHDHREVRRADPPPPAAPAARGGANRHDHPRDRDMRESRDAPRRSSDRRPATAAAVDPRSFDRESRELERQLAKVQRELEQLESGRIPTREKLEKIERESRRAAAAAAASSTTHRRSSPPARGSVRKSAAAAPPPRHSLAAAAVAASSYHRLPRSSAAIRPALRPTRPIGRRQTAVLPSLMDAMVPRPGMRRAAFSTRRGGAWEAPTRRGPAPRPPLATRRIPAYAAKRGGPTTTSTVSGGVAKTTTLRGRREQPALSSREKVRRAKEKMKREEERRKRNEKKREERSKESRVKRKEEDFAWLETIMSEDEELDEEANRKLLLALRQRRLVTIIDHSALVANTIENLDEMMEGQNVENDEPVLWTAEEADAIELLPIIDPTSSLKDEVAAAFLAAHPDLAFMKVADANGNGEMEE